MNPTTPAPIDCSVAVLWAEGPRSGRVEIAHGTLKALTADGGRSEESRFA